MITWGLGLIAIAWLVQLGSRGVMVRPTFVVLYALGAAILTWQGYLSSGFSTATILNLIALIGALLVFRKRI